MGKYTSIMTDDYETCFVCGRRATDWHHCLHGADKKKSEADGLMVPLCRSCHNKVHHEGGELDRILKRQAQQAFLIHRYGRCCL